MFYVTSPSYVTSNENINTLHMFSVIRAFGLKNSTSNSNKHFCFQYYVEYINENYRQLLASYLLFVSLMTLGLLVLRVLKNIFCKNLQLALLFQILVEDTEQKTIINSSYTRFDGIPIKLFKTGIIQTIAIPLLSWNKFSSVLKLVFSIIISFSLFIFVSH